MGRAVCRQPKNEPEQHCQECEWTWKEYRENVNWTIGRRVKRRAEKQYNGDGHGGRDVERYDSGQIQVSSLPKAMSQTRSNKGQKTCPALSVITATFTGPRQTSLFPKAAQTAAPCTTYCCHASRSLRVACICQRCVENSPTIVASLLPIPDNHERHFANLRVRNWDQAFLPNWRCKL